MAVATTTAVPRPYVADVPLHTMLCRSPTPTSSQRGRLNQPPVGGHRVAFLEEDDVAGHDLRRGDARPLAAANDVCLCRRHLAKRRHRLLGSRLQDIAHQRVEQDDGQDGDRLVRQRRIALVQPQPARDRGGHEQQDDESVLKLTQELPPGGYRLFRRQLVPAVALEPGPRLRLTEAEPWVATERCERLVHGLPVGV
jgi:hypothetical protein